MNLHDVTADDELYRDVCPEDGTHSVFLVPAGTGPMLCLLDRVSEQECDDWYRENPQWAECMQTRGSTGPQIN